MTPPPAHGPQPEPGALPEPEPGPGPGAQLVQGLQVERTQLAWRRTALAGTATALLAARQAFGAGPHGLWLVPLTLAGWVALLLVAFRPVRGRGPGRPPPVGRAIALVTLTVGYAALGVALIATTG